MTVDESGVRLYSGFLLTKSPSELGRVKYEVNKASLKNHTSSLREQPPDSVSGVCLATGGQSYRKLTTAYHASCCGTPPYEM